MTGAINETYLSDLHARRRGSQQTGLEQFTNQEPDEELGTTIAVVTDPTGGIRDVTDEFIPELGMPEPLLNAIRERRSELEANGRNEVNAHNQSIDELGVEQQYREYLSEEQSDTLDILAERVRQGETITFVCFEKEPKWCHRRILADEVENRL